MDEQYTTKKAARTCEEINTYIEEPLISNRVDQCCDKHLEIEAYRRGERVILK
jgi:hypothetical protein